MLSDSLNVETGENDDRIVANVSVQDGDLTAAQHDDIARAAVVAIDTETTGLDWRRDRLATVQVFTPTLGAIIVQIADATPPRLAKIIQSPAIVKVFHHAPFDLRFLRSAWGVDSSAVRCTKVASKLLNPEAANADHSLAALARRFLDVTLPKGSVRTSAWDSQTLSAEQLEYAANDVRYLLPLEARLRHELTEKRRADLYGSCCEFLPTRVDLELGDYPDVFSY